MLPTPTHELFEDLERQRQFVSGSVRDFRIAEMHPHPSHLWVDEVTVARLQEVLRQR